MLLIKWTNFNMALVQWKDQADYVFVREVWQYSISHVVGISFCEQKAILNNLWSFPSQTKTSSQFIFKKITLRHDNSCRVNWKLYRPVQQNLMSNNSTKVKPYRKWETENATIHFQENPHPLYSVSKIVMLFTL